MQYSNFYEQRIILPYKKLLNIKWEQFKLLYEKQKYINNSLYSIVLKYIQQQMDIEKVKQANILPQTILDDVQQQLCCLTKNNKKFNLPNWHYEPDTFELAIAYKHINCILKFNWSDLFITRQVDGVSFNLLDLIISRDDLTTMKVIIPFIKPRRFEINYDLMFCADAVNILDFLFHNDYTRIHLINIFIMNRYIDYICYFQSKKCLTYILEKCFDYVKMYIRLFPINSYCTLEMLKIIFQFYTPTKEDLSLYIHLYKLKMSTVEHKKCLDLFFYINQIRIKYCKNCFKNAIYHF